MSSVFTTLLKASQGATSPTLVKESAILKAAKAKLGLGLNTPDITPPKIKRTKAQVQADAEANKLRKLAEKAEAKRIREAEAEVNRANRLKALEAENTQKYLDKTYKKSIREYNRAVVDFQNLHSKAVGQGYLTDKQLTTLQGHYAAIEDYGASLSNLKRGGYSGDFPKEFQLPPGSFNQTSYKPPKPKPTNPADYAVIKRPEPTSKGKIPEETIELNIKDEARPKGFGLGGKGSKNYRTEDDIGFAPDETIDINATDNIKYKPTPEDLAARKKQIELEQEIHRMANGANLDPDFVKHMQNSNDIFQTQFTKAAAFVDQLAAVVGKDNASRILANSAEGVNVSAAHYLKNFIEESESKLQSIIKLFDEQLDISAWSVLSKDKYAANIVKERELKQGLTERLLINAQEFREGKTISFASDFRLQGLVDEYVKSDIAISTNKKLHSAGVVKDLDANPFSIPTKHSYEAIESRIESGRIVKEDYYEMIGDQLKLNPNFHSRYKDTKIIGKAFYDRLEDKVRKGAEANYTPISSGDSVLDADLDSLFIGSSDFNGKVKFDFLKTYTSKTTGETFRLGDFIDIDIFENVRAYNTRAGGLYGLSKSGLLVDTPDELLTIVQKEARQKAAREGKAPPIFLKTITSEADFVRWSKSFVDAIPAGAASKEAQTILDNTLHLLMGRAVGEEISAGFQAASTLATTILLKASGVLNLLDTASMAFFSGGLSVLGSLVASLPSSKFWKFVGKDMTTAEAEESIAYILAGRKAASGNSRGFGHFINNSAYAGNRLYEAIGHMGRKTTWYNMSEHVRRMQLFTMARIIDSEMAKLAKGGARGRKSLYKYFKDAGVTEEMVEGWGEAIRKFGHDTRKWSADYHPERFNLEVSSLLDRVILGTYAGELPGFLTSSSIAKAILPFTSASFALTNKLTRYTAKKGNLAIAELIAYQAPAALAVTYLREVAAGRNPEDMTPKQVIFGFLSSLSVLGSFALFLNAFSDHGLSAGSVVTAFPNKFIKVLEKGTMGEADVRDLLAVMPLYAIHPGLNLLTGRVFYPD